MKKKRVEVKAETLFEREGVSIYIDGGLSKHVITARSLYEELKYLDAIELFDIVFR
jgi:hypothetical protein